MADTDVQHRGKMECSLLCLCFQDDPFFALDFGHMPNWKLFELLPFFVHGSFASRIFIAWSMWVRFSTVWSSWSLGRILPKRFLVESWPSKMRAWCCDFRLLDSPHIALCQNVFNLQSMAASIGNSNFFNALEMVSLNFLPSRSIHRFLRSYASNHTQIRERLFPRAGVGHH